MMYGVLKNPRIRLLTPPIVIILCFILIVPVFSGCSNTGVTSTNRFLELLSLVPTDFTESDGPFAVNFTLIDYASLYRDVGISFSNPEELLDSALKDQFARFALGVGSFILGYGRYMDTSTIREKYIGYDVTCVDAEIQFGYPPINGIAAIGRFDPQATKNAFSNQDEWPSWAITAYTTEDYRSVTIHSWGSGLENHLSTRLIPPHVDELGRARPLAITDKYLFSAASVEDVKLIIDASQNQYSSVADLPEYTAIANGLAELKAYAAIVGKGTIVNYPLFLLFADINRITEGEREQLENSLGPRLKNFLTFGSGLGRDEKGTYTAIVLYHESTNNAQANVSLLKQRIESAESLGSGKPWSEIITDTEIRVKGNLLLAKLYTTSVALWSQWLYANDTLLLHEE